MGRIITAYSRPKPVVTASGFYFSAGYNGGGTAELWTTDGTTVSLVWTDPTGGNLGIDHLAHSTVTGKMYIFCSNYAPSIGSSFDVAVYRLDPADNSVTFFTAYNYTDELFTVDKPPTHAAEYGGALYISHQGGNDQEGAYVASMNVSSGATARVAGATGTTALDRGAGGFTPDYTGGLGVIGSTLYWTDGIGLWSGSGGLGFDSYLGYPDPITPSDIDGFGAAGNPVSNPLDSTVYIPGQYGGNESTSPDNGYGRNANISRRIVDQGGSTIVDLGCLSDTTAPDQGGAFFNRVACCAMLYDTDDLTPLAMYALDDGAGGFGGTSPINTFVWRGGAWTADVDLQAVVPGCRGLSNSMKSLGGALYVMTYVAFDSTYLLKRSVAGSWSIVHTFTGYAPDTPSGRPPLLPVGRVSATIKCHQM